MAKNGSFRIEFPTDRRNPHLLTRSRSRGMSDFWLVCLQPLRGCFGLTLQNFWHGWKFACAALQISVTHYWRRTRPFPHVHVKVINRPEKKQKEQTSVRGGLALPWRGCPPRSGGSPLPHTLPRVRHGPKSPPRTFKYKRDCIFLTK